MVDFAKCDRQVDASNHQEKAQLLPSYARKSGCCFLQDMPPSSFLNKLLVARFGDAAQPCGKAVTAARCGNLEPVQYAFKYNSSRVDATHSCFTELAQCFPGSVSGGDPGSVSGTDQNCFQMFKTEVAEAAAGSGMTGFPVLEWMTSHEPAQTWKPGVCMSAATSGSLHSLLYLRRLEGPCPWQVDVCALKI